MTPLVPFAAGLAALIGAWLVLRSIGSGYRVGRLLASAPRVQVEEAIRMASEGRRAYVRVDGRIDAEREFEDADHRPLVFRRTRLQARQDGRWKTFEDGREGVEFGVREGLASIGVDSAALDNGLVVVPRESVGAAADVGDRAPAGLLPATPVRAVIEQISSVEHAIVLGVPVSDPTGRPRMTAGLGRPLVLTTLEPPEAMRILARDVSATPRLAALLLGLAVVLEVLAVAWWLLGLALPPVAAGASPGPGDTPVPSAVGGDPRSSLEGPGLVGNPLLAIALVVGIGIAAVILTLAYVRLTAPRAKDR